MPKFNKMKAALESLGFTRDRPGAVAFVETRFHPDQIDDLPFGSSVNMGQILCPLTYFSMEGWMEAEPGFDRERNATFKGGRSVSDAILPSDLDPGNGQQVNYWNCQQGCRQTKPTRLYKRRHCCVDKAAKDRTAELMKIVITYLTECGIYVYYFNCGGTATRALMRKVERELDQIPSLFSTIDSVGLQHMSRLTRGPTSWEKRSKQVKGVTNAAKEWSRVYVDSFISDWNLVRIALGLKPITVSKSPYERLLEDKRVIYVAEVANDGASAKRFDDESSKFTKKLAHRALLDSLRQPSSTPSSVLDTQLDKATKGMDDDEKIVYRFYRKDTKTAAAVLLRESKGCQKPGCCKLARKDKGSPPFCIGHGGGKRCEFPGCGNGAQGTTRFCSGHGGGKRCEFPGCGNGATGTTRFCIGHGGGKRCEFPGCGNGAEGTTRFCSGHGGGKRCEFPGCGNGAIGSTPFCSGHGGGKRCEFPGCGNGAQGTTPFCIRHGGGKRCEFPGCGNGALGSTGFCSRHGGGKRCQLRGCEKGGLGSGFCGKHSPKCHRQGCKKKSYTKSGYCTEHNPKKQK